MLQCILTHPVVSNREINGKRKRKIDRQTDRQAGRQTNMSRESELV